MTDEIIWQPSCQIQQLKQRATLLAQIRTYFNQTHCLEVETPALSSSACFEPFIEPIRIASQPPKYLHTSAEMAMKRLLAAGSGSIYQICKVFRDAELGQLHNPEFTMLEWYRVDKDYHGLMDEVATLITAIAWQQYQISVQFDYINYQQAFQSQLNFDPLKVDLAHLQQLLIEHNITISPAIAKDKDACLDLIFSVLVQKNLPTYCFVYHYPASQAAMACLHPDDPTLALRFEVFWRGIELANGYQELTQVDSQRSRLQSWSDQPQDDRFLAALSHGLPECSGVALGLDRLLMCLTGVSSIAEVLSFDDTRA